MSNQSTIRIIPPLTPTSRDVGGLRLNDTVLTDVGAEAAIAAISSYLMEDKTSISCISSNVSTISTDLITVSSSLSAYTKLSVFNLSVSTLSTMIDGLKEMIDDLSSKAIFYYLNNVSFLKAEADDPTNLCMWFYTDSAMSTMLSIDLYGQQSDTGSEVIFDSANEFDRNFIEALLINNEENDEDSSVEYLDGFHLYENEHGTQWMKPIDDKGFGEEYNNAPVVVRLVDWALNSPSLSNWVSTFGRYTKLYAKYVWYYYDVDDGQVHASDAYALILPALAEQSAPRSTSYNGRGNAPSQGILTATWRDDSSPIDGFADEAYEVVPNVTTVLSNGIDNDDYYCIYLKDYSLANEYRMKFKVNGSLPVVLGGRENIGIAGNGEYLSEFNSYGLLLEGNKTYLISILAGMITILASK